MLDVHPPHHPTNTWRDFFIHVATICVGLLIAVGLEQTVEAIHHAHQRQELREALHSDTELNNTWVKNDITEVERLRSWAIEQLSAVEQAGPSGTLKMHRLPARLIFVPNTGVWLAAKQNGEISLLSVGEQNWLNDMNRLEDGMFVQSTGGYARTYAGLAELDRQLFRRTGGPASGDMDLSGFTPAQRLQLDDSLRTCMETLKDFESGLLDYSTYTEFLLSTPADELEQANAVARFTDIDKRNREIHPDLMPSMFSR